MLVVSGEILIFYLVFRFKLVFRFGGYRLKGRLGVFEKSFVTL